MVNGFERIRKNNYCNAIREKLIDIGNRAYVLDGDNLRFGINSDLGFSTDDRKEILEEFLKFHL